MSSPESRQAIERVKLAAPIDEIVRARVPELKRAGAEWRACCPFHAEKTPSFYVNPAKGIWHCFGACGEGGDAIAFVQRFDGLAFWEAVEMLANQYGIELPKQRRAVAGEEARFERLFDALERAATHYERKLAGPEGEPARAYLSGRRLAPTTQQAFRIGWAPEHGNTLLEAALQAGFAERTLIEAGLVRRREGGGEAYDFFRGRLMIPIRDRIGRVVGFGARVLPGSGRDGPKYVNTPETELFKKGSLIFGLDRALDAARRERHLILMEGYTDVMAAHQVGVHNAVAVLGTSTTQEHAQLARRTGARRISLIFDGDEAGRRAAARALGGLLPLGAFDVDVVPLPEGEDPADFLLRAGADAFRERLSAPIPWFEFLAQGLAGREPAALAEGVDELLAVVARVPRPVEQEGLVRALAVRLELPEAAVTAQWEKLPQRRADRSPQRGASPGSPHSRGNTEAAAGVQPNSRGQSGSTGHGVLTGNKGSPPDAPLSARFSFSSSAPSGPVSSARAPTSAAQRRVRRAWGELAGAMLVDNSLIPAYRSFLEVARGRGVLDAASTASSLGGGAGDGHGHGGVEGGVEGGVDGGIDGVANGGAHDGSREVSGTTGEAGSPNSDGALPPCPDEGILRVLETVLALYDEERVDARGDFLPVDTSAVLSALAEDPAARLPASLSAHAERAESARALADGALGILQREARERLVESLRRPSDPSDEAERLRDLNRLFLQKRAARRESPAARAQVMDPADPTSAADSSDPHPTHTLGADRYAPLDEPPF